MAKKRRTPPSKQQIAASQAQQAAAEAARAKVESRRAFLARLRNLAIAVPVLGLAGYYTLRTVQAGAAETDLTRIGQGIPTIVQIHDPQCGDCQVLEGQIRSILSDYDDTDVTYLVAYLTGTEGQAFAGRYGVGRVTLVLLDGAGTLVHIIRGPIEKEALRQAIAGYLATSS